MKMIRMSILLKAGLSLIIIIGAAAAFVAAPPRAFSQVTDGWLWTAQNSNSTATLFDVSAFDANHVWAVGSSGTILYFNGSYWSHQSSGTSAYLYGVSATSADDVWAVGESGSGGIVLHYDGDAWQTAWQGPPDGTGTGLYGVCALATNDVWAVGSSNVWSSGSDCTVMHWNGSAWSGYKPGSIVDLEGVAVLDANHIWAVGLASILHWNGSSWSNDNSGHMLNDIYAYDENNVWAVGGYDASIILYFNGTSWAEQSYETNARFEDVTALGADDVWAVGEGGTILHFNGTSWKKQSSGTTNWLYGVSALDSDNIWAVGQKGTILHGSNAKTTSYLAEGSTKWGFDCYVSIVNPNTTTINVVVTYMTASGPVAGPTIPMPAASQTTVYPKGMLGEADFSTKVECLEGKTIAVDRTMYWTGADAPCSEAHCATGVTEPATTWYMPEGSSDWGFECFLLIQNPNDQIADCHITWMIEDQAPVVSNVSVLGNARSTFNMADYIGAKDASIRVTSDLPVICERAMYRNNRREGHDSTGTPQAAAGYYLAEGCTGFGFTTYVLVQNPQETSADVTITYQATTGPVTGPSFKMPANSRKTICVNDTTTIPGDDPSFSTHVHGSAPIIAERAMYWNGGPDNAQVCHDSIGLDQPHRNWYLADGQSSGGAETWTLVQNPNDTAITVEITYLTPGGTGNVTKTETIAANSRKSFNMQNHSGISGRAAIMVVSKTSGKKIMCERAMYWFSRGAGTDTIGGYSD